MTEHAIKPRSEVTLSRRESEVLHELARGHIDKEVATGLGISLGTVRVYRKRLSSKLGVRGAINMLLVAWKRGLIDLDTIANEAHALSEERLSRTG